MSALVSILAGRARPRIAKCAMSGAATVAEELRDEAASCEASARDEQIEALVEQLFFRTDAGPVRYVGFAASESSTETAALCLAVARTLAEDGRFDIGLVDASPGTLPLHTRLEIAPTPHAESSWPLGPRLWLVPCQTWLPAGNHQRIPEHSLSRLRELTREFDFAVVHCPAVSWLTFRIGQACDGIVLVLTANQTRRVVAAQMKDQLQKAQVPLLGTVLTERRLPVPEGLYRKL